MACRMESSDAVELCSVDEPVQEGNEVQPSRWSSCWWQPPGVSAGFPLRFPPGSPAPVLFSLVSNTSRSACEGWVGNNTAAVGCC